jgi:hypothetical protein
MPQNKTMTAPLAVIKVNGVAIGKMKSIRCTETFRQQPVVGLGNLTAEEMAKTGWSASLNCGFYMIDLRVSAIPGALNRVAQTKQEWENNIILDSSGVQVDIMRKVVDQRNPVTGLITTKLEVFASIKGLFVNRESFDITEGQISGRDMDFEYITPILFPI